MSDELNVWRDAKSMQEYRPLPSQAAADELSAAVIRTYGDKRDADAYQRGKLEGARLALEAAKTKIRQFDPEHYSVQNDDGDMICSIIADDLATLDPDKIVGEG